MDDNYIPSNPVVDDLTDIITFDETFISTPISRLSYRTKSCVQDESKGFVINTTDISISSAIYTDVPITEFTLPTEFPSGIHQMVIDWDPQLAIFFDEAVTVRQISEGIRCQFPSPTDVVVSQLQSTIPTIRIPKTHHGVATYLSVLSSTFRIDTPLRSNPAFREPIPDIDFDDSISIPKSLSSQTSAISITVPPSIQSLFSVAPLAYYTGANVQIRSDIEPRVKINSSQYTLSPLSESVPEILRFLFWEDCFVRLRRNTDRTFNSSRFASIDLDQIPSDAVEDRLHHYLTKHDNTSVEHFPDWPLAMYVEPKPRNIAFLPWLLQKFALIYPPSVSELTGNELIKRTLDDFYRQDKTVPSVNIVKPTLQHGQLHGWLADGTPVDVFKVHPNIPKANNHSTSVSTPISVSVIVNDEKMREEKQRVEDIYASQKPEILDVEFHRNITCDELATIFEEGRDFVHFIGHCERRGLSCSNGYLSIASLNKSATTIFFLNACGSYFEGQELINKGSHAGAITYRKVLNDQAATVGVGFVRLLLQGFCVERALQFARRRVMMGKDYAIVGDGTYVMNISANKHPVMARVTSNQDGYTVTYESFAEGRVGEIITLPDDAKTSVISGMSHSNEYTNKSLEEVLDNIDCPVLCNGELRWPS